MASQINDQGFTLVELLLIVAIVAILGSIGLATYRQQTKKAYATEVQSQLSAASKKLILAAQGVEETTETNCIENADLHDSNNFTYSCAERDGTSNIFDIHVKPLKDVGVGGVLSFGIGHDKICWDTCDANGSGASAVLAKSHLGLSDNCSALTRNERSYNCNCTNQNYKTCGWRKCNCRCPRGWGCRCDRCYRCNTRTRQVCETCTDIYYTNENGVVVDIE